jgi:hypothetical protein
LISSQLFPANQRTGADKYLQFSKIYRIVKEPPKNLQFMVL